MNVGFYALIGWLICWNGNKETKKTGERVEKGMIGGMESDRGGSI
jgi:hypothetical protein